MKPKTITLTDTSGMEEMTASQLNDIHFSTKHTVLTPEILEKMSTATPPAEEKSNS